VNADRARLRRWLHRARPPRRELARALLTGLAASATGVALLVGALGLLVESATRPGLRAVALVLVVIELFAFLRSPLRFAERLSAHRLGYAAVTEWRRWLVTTVGALDYSRWRAYAAGDLLERALTDTDELQGLWLRFVIPAADTAAVMLLGDVVVAVLPPIGHWWPYALTLLAAQALGVTVLGALATREVARDRAVRHARARLRAALVELGAVTPELTLLGREEWARRRVALAVADLAGAEERQRGPRRLATLVVLVAGLAAIAGVGPHPTTSPVWLVVAAAIGLATFDSLNTMRLALRAAVEVAGGGERLEDLAVAPTRGNRPWPADATIRLHDVDVREDDRPLVEGGELTVAPGRRVALVGESGSGKSTLLRAIAALDDVDAGTITLGGVPVREIDEGELRAHVAYVVSEPGFTHGFAIDVVTLGRADASDPHTDLAALGVASERTTRFEELSRGERTRVALARAQATRPAVYLLDEPTAGLGREETARVLAVLAATGATVVVATHDADVMSWCDDVVTLREGHLEVSR
jgi:ABC-type transport system involved in cytochrome bd biosynthesis fused ATPase/permease subunit